jgi:hypothetical protein
MAGLFPGLALALRLLKHKIIRRAPATCRSRTQYGSEISRVFPSSKDNDSEHTNACCRETTGGQTRCEEAGKPGGRRWAGRGNGQRCSEQRNLGHRIPKMLPSLRIRRARTIRHPQTKAAQKERASSAWSCSNPDYGGHAMSNASICSTASLVLALSRPRSQMRTLRERVRESPQTMA